MSGCCLHLQRLVHVLVYPFPRRGEGRRGNGDLEGLQRARRSADAREGHRSARRRYRPRPGARSVVEAVYPWMFDVPSSDTRADENVSAPSEGPAAVARAVMGRVAASTQASTSVSDRIVSPPSSVSRSSQRCPRVPYVWATCVPGLVSDDSHANRGFAPAAHRARTGNFARRAGFSPPRGAAHQRPHAN